MSEVVPRSPLLIRMMLNINIHGPAAFSKESVYRTRAGELIRAWLYVNDLITEEGHPTLRGSAWATAIKNVPLPDPESIAPIKFSSLKGGEKIVSCLHGDIVEVRIAPDGRPYINFFDRTFAIEPDKDGNVDGFYIYTEKAPDE